MGKAQGPVEIFPHATRQAARSTTTQNKLVPFSLSFLCRLRIHCRRKTYTSTFRAVIYETFESSPDKYNPTPAADISAAAVVGAAVQVPCVVLQHKYIRQVGPNSYPASYEILLEFL